MFDNVRGMIVFAKVVEGGSFRAGARALGLSPSAVSTQISELEKRLGLALIYRTTRSFSMTPDGARLLEVARAVTSAAEKGLGELSQAANSPVGILRITAPAVLANDPFVSDIAAFADAFPGVALKLNFSDSRRDLVRDGFDLAIRMGLLKDSTLVARKLFAAPRALVCAPSYATKHSKPLDASDLEEWRFIGFEQRPEEVALVGPKGELVTIIGHTQIVVDDANAMRSLAIAGAGVASLLRNSITDDLREGRLTEVLAGWSLSAADAYADWPPNAPRAGLARQFVQFIGERAMKG